MRCELKSCKIWRLAASVLLCCGIIAASAFSPRDALNYRSPELDPANSKLLAAKTMLSAKSIGIGSLLSADRRDPNNYYALTLHYQQDPVAVIQARQSIAQAKDEYLSLQRSGIHDALRAHADLWNAQARVQAARARLDAAQLAKAEAQRKRDIGAAGDLDVEATSIDLTDAELAMREAAKSLVTAKTNSKNYGLTGDAAQEVLRFALPAATPEDAADYRNLKWNLDVAKERRSAAAREIKPGLGLDLNYVGANYTMSSSMSTRTRTVDVQAGYPSIYNDPSVLLWGQGWQKTLRVELPIDFTAWANARATKAEVALTQAQLVRQKETLVIKLAQSRTTAESAAERMDVACQRLTLADRKARLADARFKSGAISQIALLNEQAAFSDAQANYADAWKNYIEATAAYLELIGGKWEEMP